MRWPWGRRTSSRRSAMPFDNPSPSWDGRERRREPRVPLRVPVLVVQVHGGRQFQSLTLDGSRSGCRFLSPQALSPGETVVLALSSRSSPDVQVRGMLRVVRHLEPRDGSGWWEVAGVWDPPLFGSAADRWMGFLNRWKETVRL
ncbi:protein of unknown function [Candidatus Hydrogenisulfobacillus filiaventi]|uniref:PilZ domain-containing protein n=1 Tax=Candidatus Hydrogenisulfobacillus filiaventi TaxID=2707344 RepID=A0A6F8ZIA1_9FIRM|nr:protein of unknown function [Candidatus Hydrogenisulfobacillus filiaventi]